MQLIDEELSCICWFALFLAFIFRNWWSYIWYM